MRPVGYGRPGTEVIPTSWAVSHRPVAEKTMTATAAIRLPGGTQTWSDELDQNVETPHAAYYDGACRVQALATQARMAVTANDPEMVAGYLVTVPAAVAPDKGHLVTVTGSGDSTLDGRVLQIRQVVRGSIRFERDLFCTLID